MSNPTGRRQTARVSVLADPRSLEGRLSGLCERLPPRPHALDALEAHGLCSPSVDTRLALRTVREALCGAEPGAAATQVWIESVAAGIYAESIAARVGFDPAAAGLAGLLHRGGELLCLRELAALEAAGRLSAELRAVLLSQHAPSVLESLARGWALAPACGAAVIGWRRYGMHGRSAREAMAVYLANLLALQARHPGFCAPGTAESVARDLGVSADELAEVRTRAEPALTKLVEAG